VLAAAGLLLAACVRLWGPQDFAYGGGKGRPRRNPAPYGRIGGKPIIPNPEAEKFPGGVPRDEDGFPVITLREQYETNLTMYNEGLGPFPGPPMDFSGDWDFVPPDPEDEDFDPNRPLGAAPPDPPEELMTLQEPGTVDLPSKTPDDEPVPETYRPPRKVAAAPEPDEPEEEEEREEEEEPLPGNLQALKVPELKELLTRRGLPITGTKATLIKRLQDSAR